MGRGQSTPMPVLHPRREMSQAVITVQGSTMCSPVCTHSRELDGQEVGVANTYIRNRTGH